RRETRDDAGIAHERDDVPGTPDRAFEDVDERSQEPVAWCARCAPDPVGRARRKRRALRNSALAAFSVRALHRQPATDAASSRLAIERIASTSRANACWSSGLSVRTSS